MNLDVKDVGSYIVIFIGSVAGGISWLIGGMDTLLITFIVFMFIDIFTGVASGAVNGKLSSEKGWQGLIKKIVFLLLLVVANLIDYIVGATGVIRGAFLAWAIGNEGLSILENADKLGVNFPSFLTKAFAGMQEKINDVELPLTPKIDTHDETTTKD